MALVKQFSEKDVVRTSVHNEVAATFHVFRERGEVYLQIDTYGAPGRQIAGKVSQSIQLGAEGRAALLQLLSDL